MKRLGSVLILMGILAMPAHAQRQGRMRGPTRPNEIGNLDRIQDLPADEIIRLQERLSLSGEQVERVKEAQRSDREARDALRLEARGMRDQLRDEKITREEFREEMAGRRTGAVDGMIAYRETLEGILTDEQRSQMRSLRRQENRGRSVRRGGPAPGRFQARGRVSRGFRAQRGRRNTFFPTRGGRALRSGARF